MFGVQTFASIDTDIGVAIYVRDDLLRTRCLHDNHLYFVAHRRRFAVIKMIAADYTIALARAARLVHLASSESISPAPLEENTRSILINTREGMEARDLRTVEPPKRSSFPAVYSQRAPSSRGASCLSRLIEPIPQIFRRSNFF